MAYEKNPRLPRLRMEAVRMVESGLSIRAVARHYGYAHNTVINWVKRARTMHHNVHIIPTRSSRPLHHPHTLPPEIVSRILSLREERQQCAEILHWRLQKDGVQVSLSSIKRTLKRSGISRFSKWKKWHCYPARPFPEKPGILVEIDTIYDGPVGTQLYLYTGLDVCSRWAYALPVERINTRESLKFIAQTRTVAPFSLATLQSDHGPEFSKHFTKMVAAEGIAHRHSRVRQPNDNAHLERFNRTIQDECISKIPRSLTSWKKELPEYLHYYNFERPHMGINYQTPITVVRSY